MQKRLLFIACLLLAVGQKMVAADGADLITISDFSISSGQSKEIGIELTNREIYVGFQFDLQLPQGFTVDTCSANANRIPDGTSLRMSQQSDGSYRFVAAALDGSEITGNSGTVVNITVTAGQNLTEGSYTGYIRDIKLSKADGSGTTVTDEQPFTITVKGSEPYAALSDNGTVLTFYYDKQSEQRGGMAIGPFDIPGDRRWESNAEMVTTVVFDASFADYRPTSTAFWFYGFQNLTAIRGISNLKTDNVTDMQYMFHDCNVLTSLDVTGFNTANVTNMCGMFYKCHQLQTLDLSNFNTASVTNMSWMFFGCYALTTIYAGSYWTTSSVTTEEDGAMFMNCRNLVGSKGTAYSEDHTDLVYARIDGGTDAPGYLFDKNAETSYRVMISVVGNGEVSYGQPDVVTGGNEVETTVDAGGSLELIFFPAEGYKFSQLMVDTLDYTAMVTTDAQGVISYTLSNIYDSHNITVTFASMSKVDTPTASWSGDQLTLTTATEGATIYYTNSADIAQGGEGTVTPGGGNGTLYEGPITISADAQITAWAVKEEMINSDTLYIDYPYTAWQTLLSAISTGQTVLRNAEVSTRVSDDMKSTLSSLIADAQDMYGVRTATESVILDKAREINELAEEMQRIIDQVEEAYAALSDNNTVLTFYYDYDKSTRNGMTLAFYAYEPSDRGWNDNAGMITKVVFDESFANYQPTSTANWLSGLSSLTSIEGMSYLKTDSVTNMWNMFGECVSLTSIDLSGFKTGKVENMGDLFGGCSGLTSLDVSYLNTENVVNMQGMFRGCSSLTTLDLSGFKTDKVSSTYSMFSESSNLKTIYVGSGWNTTINPSSEYMFLDCVSLVGGAGTVYSHDHNDFTYAHIDGGVDNPGYLTSIADTAAVAPVTFSRNMFELTLSCATPNVTIMYAIPDNETGEMTWQTYTTPLTLTGDCTVHAYAIRPNGIRSAETSYTFRASDVQQAETPTFAWIGDQLTLTTATEGASIYYINSAGATGETLYEGPVTITADALITAWAVKEEMRNSDTLTIDYPYTLWSRLVTATKDATTTANIAANSSKVDPQMVQSLRSMIEEAEHMYSERTAERDRIQWMINELSMMISEINVQLSSAEFSFDGQTLTVSGETTLTAAVEAAGGRAHVSESVTAIFWETTATINADSLRAVGITNPNLLLYVNTASQAPADVPNVIVGDVASRIVLTDVEGEQNANFNCPRPFVAQRITYSRNFKQHTQVGVSRGWETLALPFNVQVIYKEDGTELVPFAANSQDHRTRPFWLKKVYGGELADADAIEAYKPYLLSLPNDPSVYPADYCLSGTVRFISENVTVAETNPETNYLGVNDIAVVPTFSRVEQSDEVYALNVSQELENQPEGSVFEAGLRDVRPFECYTIHTNAGPAPAFMTVADLLSGGLTGITPAVSGLPANDTEAWYTLDGRKLQERPAAKGLYIHQGRKVVVK